MKNKRNTITNLLKLGVFLFGVSLLLWNCQDETIEKQENNIATVRLEEALNLFKATSSAKLYTNTYFVAHLEKIHQEDIINSTERLTIIPVSTKDSGYYSRILMLKINDQIESVVFSMYSANTSSNDSFSGEILITDLKGTFLNGFRVKSGRIISQFIKTTIANKSSKHSSKTSNEVCEVHGSDDPNCILNTQYLDEVVISGNSSNNNNLNYLTIEDLYGTGGGYDGSNSSCEVNCDGWDYGDGGGGTSSNTTEDDIIDNTNNPCVSAIIKALQEKDMKGALVPDLEGKGHLSEMVLDLFGKCKNYDLTINIAQLGTNPEGHPINAQTNGIESITLDTDLVKDATQLSIAKTLIHESLHAFINLNIDKYNRNNTFIQAIGLYYTKYNNDSNLSQHNFISQFVEAVAYSLSAYDNHQQSMEYYTAVSWGGLESSDAYKALSNTKKTAIQKIINNERYAKSDAKSTKCP